MLKESKIILNRVKSMVSIQVCEYIRRIVCQIISWSSTIGGYKMIRKSLKINTISTEENSQY
jgi:hypothetical protein